MLADIPLSIHAGGSDYRRLTTRLSGFDRPGGATLLTFTGMHRSRLKIAAQEFARAVDKPLFVPNRFDGQPASALDSILHRAGAGALLLLDEADSLFGRRSGVRDGHDRYANEYVSYLVQALARYRVTGIVLEPYEPPPRHVPAWVAHRVVRFPPP